MVKGVPRLPGERRLQGIPLSPGIAIGKACFYERQPVEPDSTSPVDPRREIQRLRNSLRWLARQRAVLARKAETLLGPRHAEIFDAHRLMLMDKSFQLQLVEGINENGYSAEQAINTTLNFYQEQFASSDSEYLRQRAADFGEIQQSLLDFLKRLDACRRCGDSTDCNLEQCRLDHDHILLCKEITANLPIETDHHTVGFIVEKGAPSSHAIILARALRCPVVGNIHNLPASIPVETEILIDGDSGEVILDPTAETLARYKLTTTGRGQAIEVSAAVPGLKVMANIALSADVGDALAAGAEGIGLYRTEMELLVAGRPLNEAEQYLRYSEVVKAMPGRPVCIRLLDLGTDKTAAWLETALQDATRSGLRGSHLLLAHPELLREQARALARASIHGPIQVLYPMISTVEQFLEIRTLFDASVADLQPVGLQHGVLFEVPGACLVAQQLMQAADFGCIGSNDLIQYLFAENRSETDASSYTRFETDPALWELIEKLSRTAADASKPMTICGELAGNPALTATIVNSGITVVSTSPSYIARVRQAAQNSAIQHRRI